MAQEKNYFYEIKEFEENYSSRSVVSRFVHSVGFRYYWATEGLRDEDLNYKPSESGISTRETLEHIYNLSIMIKNGSKNAEFKMSKSYSNLSFDELRSNTLNNLKESISIIENLSIQKELQIKNDYRTKNNKKPPPPAPKILPPSDPFFIVL